MTKVKAFPKTVFLVVNSRCNLRCKMCDIGQNNSRGQFYQVMKRNGDMLSPEVISRLIKEVNADRPCVAITGTEPLLYAHLRKVSEQILACGLKLQITTNGYLLEDFASFFVEAGLTELWVSLDGPREVHDRIRGVKGSFDRAVTGIRQILNLKQYLGRDLPRVSINFTISDLNQHHLTDFLCTLVSESIAPEKITFCHTNFVTEEMARIHNRTWGHVYPAASSCNSGFKPQNIDPDALWEQVRQSKDSASFPVIFSPDLKDRDAVEIFYHHPERFVTSKYCAMANLSAQILADGTLTASTRCLDISLGNLNNASFLSLWYGQKRKDFLAHLNRAGAFPACARCCGIF